MVRRRARRNRQVDVGGPPSFTTIAPKLKNYGLMLLLFETPSGFAVFTFSEVHFYLPNTLRDIWAEFADAGRACFVTMLIKFKTFDDKSSAINADTGVNKRLADMIYKCRLPGMKLAVGKPEYKTIIESNLGIPCMHNAIVMGIMWGIQHLMHKLLPEEKAEVAKDDRFPMSQGLKMFLNNYGFDVEPEMINEQIVATACAMFDCDAVYRKHFEYLGKVSVCFKKVSDINCEHWGARKFATALKVVCCPEEEDDDFHKVLSEDELLKLKEEAPKYKDLVSKVYCTRIYEKISTAHQVRAEKKRLLRSLVKEAKAACEKSKLHGESEQIPQEHVMFANLCRMILPVISALKPPYVHEPPLPKGLKRSWDSALSHLCPISLPFVKAYRFVRLVVQRLQEHSVFLEPSLQLPKPLCHISLSLIRYWVFWLKVSQNIDVDNMGRDHQYINLGYWLTDHYRTIEVGIEATVLPWLQLVIARMKPNFFNIQSRMRLYNNNIENQVRFRPPKSLSNPSSPEVTDWWGEVFVNHDEDQKRQALVNFALIDK